MTAAARANPLGFGEAAPLLHFRAPGRERFAFGSLAGRFLLVGWLGRLDAPVSRQAAEKLLAAAGLQHNDHRVFTVLLADGRAPQALFNDGAAGRLAQALHRQMPLLLDHDLAGWAAWGLLRREGEVAQATACWYLLDPQLRVVQAWPLDAVEAALASFAALPLPAQHAGVPLFAPALLVPRIFEPDFCRQLIAAFEAGEQKPSGVTREIDGRTEVVPDDGFKRRSDVILHDEALRQQINQRLAVRLLPQIAAAFQFQVTRLERYIVSCYPAADQGGGFFRPHRDNTTRGTAHRRFAVTINLNADDYDGGDLRFPEFGPALHRAPTGGAVVFSCSLLHEAMPVTRGRRYAFLPFLYDDAAAALRDRNREFLGDSLRGDSLRGDGLSSGAAAAPDPAAAG